MITDRLRAKMLKIVLIACLVGAIAAASTHKPLVCGPVCMMYCPYGMVADGEGCPICKCNEAPIDVLKAGESPCSPVLCKMYCANGWQKNEEGCEICACA